MQRVAKVEFNRDMKQSHSTNSMQEQERVSDDIKQIEQEKRERDRETCTACALWYMYLSTLWKRPSKIYEAS